MGIWDCSDRVAKARARRLEAKLLDGRLRLAMTADGAESRVEEFPKHLGSIKIGRDASWADYTIEPTETRVSGRHLELRRQASGQWEVVRQGDRFVAVNGKGVVDRAVLRPGDVLVLGSMNGPRIRFDIVAEPVAGTTGMLLTRTQEIVDTTEDVLCRHMRKVAAALAVVAVAVIGIGGNGLYQDWQIAQRVAEFRGDVARLEELAAGFPNEHLDRLQAAAHLVVLRSAEGSEPVGTAWPHSPTELVTNAHVAHAIEARPSGTEVIVLGAATGGLARSEHSVLSWTAHPGYQAFTRFTSRGLYSRDLDGSLSRATHASAYDVAILTVATPVDPGRVLEIAPPDALQSLGAGEEIAFAGYLLRGMDGCREAAIDPSPTLHFGRVNQLRNFFNYPAAEARDQAQLVVNDIASTGGASGGPIIDRSGRVVALVSGGEVVELPGAEARDGSACGTPRLVPSGVQINYAQRADLVLQLRDGSFDAAAATAYWESQAARYSDPQRVHEQEFLTALASAAARKFDVAMAADHTAPSGHDHRFYAVRLEAGRSYGAFVYGREGGAVTLMLRVDGEMVQIASGRPAELRFGFETDTEAELVVMTTSEGAYQVKLFQSD